MGTRTSRLMVMFAAFVAGLMLCLGIILAVGGRGSGTGAKHEPGDERREHHHQPRGPCAHALILVLRLAVLLSKTERKTGHDHLEKHRTAVVGPQQDGPCSQRADGPRACPDGRPNTRWHR